MTHNICEYCKNYNTCQYFKSDTHKVTVLHATLVGTSTLPRGFVLTSLKYSKKKILQSLEKKSRDHIRQES